MSRLAAQLRQDKPMVFILLAFLLLSFTYSIINPLHEATDELRHYRFVRYLVENGRLPVQGEEACRSQSHHPPLFYALGAMATAWIEADHPLCYTPPANPFWAYRYGEVGVDNKAQYFHGADEAFPWRGDALAAHIVRGINVLIGVVVVWLTWATGRVLWPDDRWLARGAAAFIAFNPMFLYMAGAINNDIIAACSGAAITYAGVRLLHDPAGLSRKWGVWMGLAFGFALMSKFNMAAAALLIEAAVSWVAWRNKQWRLWLEVNLLIAGVTFLVAGWWFIRNYLVYGDPTGFQEVTELWGMRDPAESFGVAWSEWSSVWSSLWGRFGFGQIPLPQWVYDGLWGITLVAAAGLLIELLSPWLSPSSQSTHDAPRTTHPVPLLYLILSVLLFAAVVFAYMLVSPAGSMGRFFFPGLPAFTLLLMFGLMRAAAFLTTLLKRVNRKTGPLLTAYGSFFTTAAMFAFALIALFGYLQPAYARPRTYTTATSIPNPTHAQFDFFANLRGYELSQTTLHPGEPLDINLYWEVTGQPPGNYVLFVHLINDLGLMVAQRDTHPGLGNFPSSQWQVGDRFVDAIRIYLPETAYAPDTLTLQIGLYAPTEGYRLGITDEAGQGLGDALTLGTFQVMAPQSDVPNPQAHNFNNEILLYGYEYSGRDLNPGDMLDVTLYWEALRDDLPQYTVQVRLVDGQGHEYARADSRPMQNQSPTARWEPGQQVADVHQLQIPQDVAPNSYQIHVSLLDESSGLRQNRVAADGHWIDNQLLLAPLRISEP